MIGPSGLAPSGGELKEGVHFPRPLGRLYGFINAKRDTNSLTHIKPGNLYRLVFRKPYNQPSAEKCTPSADGISPGGGDVLRTYHWYVIL